MEIRRPNFLKRAIENFRYRSTRACMRTHARSMQSHKLMIMSTISRSRSGRECQCYKPVYNFIGFTKQFCELLNSSSSLYMLAVASAEAAQRWHRLIYLRWTCKQCPMGFAYARRFRSVATYSWRKHHLDGVRSHVHHDVKQKRIECPPIHESTSTNTVAGQ